MADQLTDKDLCEALSDIFVDNEVDYDYIASVARNFPLEHVESVLFEWVAPVCYSNGLSPVPPIWSGFESEALWRDVQELIAKEKSAGLVRKGIINIRQLYLRREYGDEWRKLSALLTQNR